MRPMAVSREQMLAGQKPIVAMALAENPPSTEYPKALDSLSALHSQGKRVCGRIGKVLIHSVKAEYTRLVDDASERVIAGDSSALADLESEDDISTRFEAERGA